MRDGHRIILLAAGFFFALLVLPHTTFAALVIDGHADDGGTFSNGSTDHVTVTTTQPNDVIVLEEFNETNGGPLATVSSISDTAGLFWHLRAATSTPDMYGTPADMEVWYATSSAPLSSDTITMTLNNTTDDGSVIAFGVNGANLSSPWDSNPSVPAESSDFTGAAVIPTVSGVSTNASNVMFIGFQGNGLSQQAGPDTADGYNEIDFTSNGGGANFSAAEAEYRIFSTAASNATISFSSGISDRFMIGDALASASQPSSAPTGRIIRLTGGLRLIGGVRLGGTSPVPSGY